MFYLRYLCLFADWGVQHILCCVFCLVCLRLMSCVPNIASFYKLSIFDCPFGILRRLFTQVPVRPTDQCSSFFIYSAILNHRFPDITKQYLMYK